MSLNANNLPKSGFTAQEPSEPGAYPARLVGLVDLGLQKQDDFKDKDTGEMKSRNPVNKLNVTYEMVDEFMKDEDGAEIKDKPKHLSETISFYSLDVTQAKSTARYKALDPHFKFGGDWSKLIGEPVVLGIIKGKPNPQGVVRNYIKDTSAMRPKDAEKIPGLVNVPRVFDLSDPDMEVFWSLPSWLQDVIKDNLDYEGSNLEKLINMGRESSKKELEIDSDDLDEKDW